MLAGPETPRRRNQARAKDFGCDPFNQNPDRSDREKWSTSKGGPVFMKLFQLDRTDPLSFGPKFWLNESRPFVLPVLYAWSFPLDKGNEGSEEERESDKVLGTFKRNTFCYIYFMKM